MSAVTGSELSLGIQSAMKAARAHDSTVIEDRYIREWGKELRRKWMETFAITGFGISYWEFAKKEGNTFEDFCRRISCHRVIQ